jgi:hypothetical protein
MAAIAIGAGGMWWITPALTCDGTRITLQDQSTRPICYRFNGPPTPAAAPETPPAVKKLGAR